MSTVPNLGELQQLVMLAAARVEDSAHGGAIRDHLADTIGRDVAVSTVYVTLVRLEKDGLVASHREAPAEGVGGPERRVFSVTEAGWAALRASRDALDEMWRGVEPA